MGNNKEIQDSCESLQTVVSVSVADLRIGNYVKHNSEWCYRGENVYEFQWDTSDWYVLGECTLFIENIEPIPLTEKWLLKFGFYYSDDENEFLELQLMHKIKLYADNSNDFSTAVLRIKENEIEIKYIHQLQNLYYALTGSELQISSITEH